MKNERRYSLLDNYIDVEAEELYFDESRSIPLERKYLIREQPGVAFEESLNTVQERNSFCTVSLYSERSDQEVELKDVENSKLSRKGEPRYVLVDLETGEIVDDAQGYLHDQRSNFSYNKNR